MRDGFACLEGVIHPHAPSPTELKIAEGIGFVRVGGYDAGDFISQSGGPVNSSPLRFPVRFPRHGGDK